MLDRLRRTFILTMMGLVTAVLAIMVGVILYMNYQQLSSDVMESVEYATSDMAFMGRGSYNSLAAEEGFAAFFGGYLDASLEESPYPDEGPGEPDAAEGNPADGGGRGAGNNHGGERIVEADLVATSVYLVDSSSQTYALIDSLELDESTRTSAVEAALSRYDETEVGCSTGHLSESGLYYGVRSVPGGMKVAFASDAYITSNLSTLGTTLLLVSLGVWAVFLVVSIVLARWVVRPTQRAWEQQQQFVADASHELKTPLAVMMANNSILLSHQDETVKSQLRWVESSQDEARQMLDLVNDMLFLARPQNTERQTVREDVDFSALVQRNVLQFEAVCFERGITLEDDIAEGVMVRGDAGRLQRLASTLIDNACKYADGQVRVSLRREGARAALAIANDGATIPAEDLPHVFDRFYRVDKARVRSEGGVGLGLAIAQEVAHEHGGSIGVTSAEEAGTTFTATLPCV